MSNQTIQVDENLYQYILSVSLREDALLRALREETIRSQGVAPLAAHPLCSGPRQQKLH